MLAQTCTNAGPSLKDTRGGSDAPEDARGGVYAGVLHGGANNPAAATLHGVLGVRANLRRCLGSAIFCRTVRKSAPSMAFIGRGVFASDVDSALSWSELLV
jgi:hypothetical protein